jgi:hypothetical protein
MKIRPLVAGVFSLLMAQAVIAGPITSCTQLPNQSDGIGGYFTSFNCNFASTGTYPFDLTNYIDDGGVASLPENYLVAGYLVWTTDATDVTNQTLTDTAAFQDVLDFVDIGSNTGVSTSVILSSTVAQGGSGSFPLASTITSAADGFLVLPYNTSGVQTFSPDDLHTFTINAAPVPEPSTLLLVFSAGLGALIVRRRRRV